MQHKALQDMPATVIPVIGDQEALRRLRALVAVEPKLTVRYFINEQLGRCLVGIALRDPAVAAQFGWELQDNGGVLRARGLEDPLMRALWYLEFDKYEWCNPDQDALRAFWLDGLDALITGPEA